MSNSIGSTLLRRYIGRQVERYRAKAGLSQQQAGDLIDHSRHWISLVEDGAENVKLKPFVIEALLTRLGADPVTTDHLVRRAKEVQSAGKAANWWHDYTEMPTQFLLYVELEHHASSIRQFAPGLVPGVVQTRDYAREILSLPGDESDEERDRLVEARIARQSLLDRDPQPHLEVFLDEAVLRRPVGSPTVMADQLDHLVAVGRRDNVEIRVVPFTAGVHGATGLGQFTTLGFPVDPGAGEPLEPPTVCVDTPAGAALLQAADALARFDAIWADLDERALDPRASEEIISTARESHHG